MEARLRRRVWYVVGGVIVVSVAFVVGIDVIGVDPDKASAFAIVVLTATLVGVTTLYVLITHDLVTETNRANEMTARGAEQEVRANAPVLEVMPAGNDHDEAAGMWTFRYWVRNNGRSVAHQARLHTKYGNAISGRPIEIDTPPNKFQAVEFRISTSEYSERDHPE